MIIDSRTARVLVRTFSELATDMIVVFPDGAIRYTAGVVVVTPLGAVTPVIYPDLIEFQHACEIGRYGAPVPSDGA